MEQLFRREVLESRKTAALGDILLINPPSFFILTAAACLLVAAALTYLCQGEFARRETVTGYLVPDKGLVVVYPAHAGVISDRRVQDGDVVAPGDTLFVVGSQRSSLNAPNVDAALIAEARVQHRSLERQRDREQRTGELDQQALAHEIAGLQEEVVSLDRELRLQQRQLDLDTEALERLRTLRGDGYLPLEQLQERERTHLALLSALAGLERERQSLRRQLETTEARRELYALRSESRIAELDRELSALTQRITELQAGATHVVRAPVAGTVTAVTIEPGQFADARTPAMTILPANSELRAMLYLPSRTIGFVKAGADVRLRYAAFPHQRFGSQRGEIVAVSNSILAPGELNAPVRAAEPVYPVEVSLERQAVDAYGETVPLKPGMLLEADIMLDRHSLLRWMFDPVYAVAGRVGS